MEHNQLSNLLRTAGVLLVISFALHFGWEWWHVGLYRSYGHWTLGFPVILLATIGDALYSLAAFALACSFKKSSAWVRDASFADYCALVALGFFIALFVEYKGLFLDRWEYTPDMPIIPIFGVGLSPVLQMTLLLPLSVWFVSLFDRRFAR